MQSIYNEEMVRRKEFDNNFEDHFVRLMFPGLDDCPLPFATEPPQPIDADLPKVRNYSLKVANFMFFRSVERSSVKSRLTVFQGIFSRFNRLMNTV